MAPTFKKSAPRQPIGVFLATPGDLADERQAFCELIELLNVQIGDVAGVNLEPLGWEALPSGLYPRMQDAINHKYIDACDVFILALHRRWGQTAPDAAPCTSYTEEEFRRALTRFKKKKVPAIYVFLKTIDPALREKPDEQLKMVLKFHAWIRETLPEEEKMQLHCIGFDSVAAFRDQVEKHLRMYVKGGVDFKRESFEISQEELKKASDKAAALDERAEKLAIILAQEAASAAEANQPERARRLFTHALGGAHTWEIFDSAFEFYRQAGEWSVAEGILNDWLAIGGRNTVSPETASALEKLGWVYSLQGEVTQAEAKYKEALTIYEKVGRIEGMATAYGNLGVIYWTRRYLGQAEKLHKKSLAIERKLGRQEKMAMLYSSLGEINWERQNLKQAIAMHKEALEINEKLGRQEELASDFGNLGLVYRTLGDLENAEVMHKRALAINERLDRREGMSTELTNLGMVYQSRDDLLQAITFLRQALAISEMLPWHEGMADQYDKLGLLYQASGDANNACKFWILASDSFARIGNQPKVQEIQARLREHCS